MKIHMSNGYLSGQLLIAMPQLNDPRFARTVLYLCSHSAEGAMGIVINRSFEGLTFTDLLEQLEIPATPNCQAIRVHFGGPVESGRGFLLHSTDYHHETTTMVDDQVSLTATVDVLKAISEGEGPREQFLALGYAGWGPGQLEAEILDNAWLNVPADADLLFGSDLNKKWNRAIGKLGFDFTTLSAEAGHA
jgi:putative transcriptional regulator